MRLIFVDLTTTPTVATLFAIFAIAETYTYCMLLISLLFWSKSKQRIAEKYF